MTGARLRRAKSLYPEILGLLESSSLRPGALIVADNADLSPDYLKRVRVARERIHVRALRRGRRTLDAARVMLSVTRGAAIGPCWRNVTYHVGTRISKTSSAYALNVASRGEVISKRWVFGFRGERSLKS